SQDNLYLTSRFNLTTSRNTARLSTSDFFTNMAQFVSVYAEVKANLNELLVSGTPVADKLKDTLRTFADMIYNIAVTCPIQKTEISTVPALTGVLEVSYMVNSSASLTNDRLLLNTLTLTLQTASPPAPAGHFPLISWRSSADDFWKPLRKNTELETAKQCI